MKVFLYFEGQGHDESVVFVVDRVGQVKVGFQQDLLEEEGCCFVVLFDLVFEGEVDDLIDVGELVDLGEGCLLFVNAGSKDPDPFGSADPIHNDIPLSLLHELAGDLQSIEEVALKISAEMYLFVGVSFDYFDENIADLGIVELSL